MGKLLLNIWIICLMLTFQRGYGQHLDEEKYRMPQITSGILLYHLQNDTTFHEPQDIFWAKYLPGSDTTNHVEIVYSDSLLIKTSQFAEASHAILALNGSFFDVEKGGSVAYMEFEGKTIALNRDPLKKWAKTDSLLNGAIVIDQSDRLIIQVSKGAAFYENSVNEKAVMVSGPILLVDGRKMPLENSAFVTKKHPRSCLCQTDKNELLFIAIDGRSNQAAGMNLVEAQQFLQSIGCKEAINLDGGGSTTLWVNSSQQGILNHPSDKEGERAVSNIIAIRKRTH